MTKIELVRPDNKFVKSYLQFMAEMEANGDQVWESNLPSAQETDAQFVKRLTDCETTARPGLVTESIYWATADGQVVGKIALRHELNNALEEFGGHIGYEVRPSARRKGIATQMLRLLLQTPKARSIGRLLLTCAPDNIASNKTIQKNGGRLEKTAYVEKIQRQTNYYWIQI